MFDLHQNKIEKTTVIVKYAFAYLRVSTEEQTVLNQRLAMQKWADNHDFQILEYFEDSAVSGKIPAVKRKGFVDMLSIVKNESVDAILIYELSRVGRTFWDTLDAIKAIEAYAPLISCSPRESFLQMTEPSVRKTHDRDSNVGCRTRARNVGPKNKRWNISSQIRWKDNR